MAKYSVVLAANTTGTGTYVCKVHKKRDLPVWYATLMGAGTFGGGTLTWYVSPDNGTTVIAMTDITDAPISMTSNKMFNTSLGTGSHNNDLVSIYVQLTGATSPAITAAVYDNNY